MNSRAKGKRGELEFAQFLREHGVAARRGVQFSGGPESPDVIAWPWIHLEIKRNEHLAIHKAAEQAHQDAGGKPWVVAHRRNGEPWRITMAVETFLDLVAGKLPPSGQAAT